MPQATFATTRSGAVLMDDAGVVYDAANPLPVALSATPSIDIGDVTVLNTVDTRPDGVADGVPKSGSVTSAATIIAFSAAELVGMGHILFGFSAVGPNCTVVVDAAANGSDFNAAAPFQRMDSPGISLGSSAVVVSQASITTAMQFAVPVTGQAMRIRISVYGGSGTNTCWATPKRGPTPPLQVMVVSVNNTVSTAFSPSASIGPSTNHKAIAAASTNATSVKGSSGILTGGVISNVTAAAKFLKFYNKATAPTVGTDTPILTIPVQANQTVGLADVVGAAGFRFTTGIAYAMTGAAADADTTALTAGDMIIGLVYT